VKKLAVSRLNSNDNLGARERVRFRSRLGRKVQVALDMQEVPEALAVLCLISSNVDIIEVGTPLCLSQGMHAVRILRSAYPDHVLVADIRIAEAGGVLARLAFEAGADWVTVVSGAPPSTFEVVTGLANEVGGDVEVELSHGWTWDLVDRCRDLGIRHFILHRSRDAELQGSLAWPSQDLESIARLFDLGGRVTVAGGLWPSQVASFADLPVEIFVAGRVLYAASDPAASALQFSGAVRSLPELDLAASSRERPLSLKRQRLRTVAKRH
jgi:3-dehydro-L-gulonate-6-phosphate decarboxylase